MHKSPPKHLELSVLFFIQAAAMGMWFVPLSSVLDAHGLAEIKPFAFATSAMACFISPLFFGAMADRHSSPVRVLRGLALATAAAMALASFAIEQRWSPWLILAIIQLHALVSTPTWSLSSTIVFARLTDAKRQFGPIRAVATLGWMAGCLLVSALNADASPRAAYSGAITWLIVAAFTFLLPTLTPARSNDRLTLRERFGLDALSLLKNRDHRVVFITIALFSIPLTAFYPFTPPQLTALGFTHITAWMTLGQITEVLAMIALAGLLTRWRLKWVIAAGLTFGVVRFGLCAVDTPVSVLASVTLHGASYTLVYITGQIYLDERIEAAWRARAQALLALMAGGFGNLLGYLGTGAWFAVNTTANQTHWPRFWIGIAVAAGLVLIYFLTAYRGRGTPLGTAQPVTTPTS
ncbi:MAG: MFS transporter [Pedosphaera sp.]|nr:MFS transporter [Pedosphaera sp.]